jgi:peptidoglycan/xylan/chitin deacetylase (PgdA/CDA1 family)
MGIAWRGVGLWQRAALAAAGLLAGLATHTAMAADCPGNPNALGTSRTLVVDPRQHRLIGTMQYRETLPLADHEIVLTFDDGPLPRNSNKILDILAAQCVKATFFTIGRMAQFSPEGVRKLLAAGHTIGTHTQNHPLGMNRMPIERAKQEIDEGIASTKAALGDHADAVAPFFRIPGLSRADSVEDYLGSQGIQSWSADFVADDWRHVSSQRVYDLAISRIEAKGKGILLLHDIQPRTVAALPRILETLKARGYRIVHVVPATVDRPATPTEPLEWLPHHSPDVIAEWPQVPHFVFANLGSLPAPAGSDFVRAENALIWRRASPPHPSWPAPPTFAPGNTATTLAAPAPNLFEIQGSLEVALHALAFIPHHTQRVASTASEPKASRRQAHGRQAHLAAPTAHLPGHHVAADSSGHKASPAAPAQRGAVKRLVQVRKKPA